MSIKQALKKNKLLAILIVAILGVGGFAVSETRVIQVLDEINPSGTTQVADDTNQTAFQLRPTIDTSTFDEGMYITDAQRTHILKGDDVDGGGHLYGTNKPCKSEFPESWDADKVIREITLIAANDNVKWKKESNGYYIGEAMADDGVKIRVVRDRQNKMVVTAYPLNMPRNPCPRQTPANDN
jgi:hypothetical protein